MWGYCSHEKKKKKKRGKENAALISIQTLTKNNNFKEPGSVMSLWYETLGFLSLRLWFLY